MNKQNSVLRISFKWKCHDGSRIVIKVVKGSEALFEIEDWTRPSLYDEWLKIDRYYNCSHDYIKNLKEGCHFELHYANFNRQIEIKDFNLIMHGKLTDNVTIDAMSYE